MRAMRYLLSATLLLSATACATFDAEQVDLRENPRPRGIFVPDQVPLLVIADGVPSVQMVRSPDRGTALRFASFLAKHDVTLEFTDQGGLKKLTSNQDTTAFPLKLLDLAKPFTDKLAEGFSGQERTPARSLQVYRIEFRDGQIERLVPLLVEGRNMPLRLPVDSSALSGDSIDSVDNAPAPPHPGKKKK